MLPIIARMRIRSAIGIIYLCGVEQMNLYGIVAFLSTAVIGIDRKDEGKNVAN